MRIDRVLREKRGGKSQKRCEKIDTVVAMYGLAKGLFQEETLSTKTLGLEKSVHILLTNTPFLQDSNGNPPSLFNRRYIIYNSLQFMESQQLQHVRFPDLCSIFSD